MRKATVVVAVLIIGAGSHAASALNAEDEMTAWDAASAAEKSGVAEEIMSRASVPGHVSRSELLDRLNQASSVSGHRHLPIREVAEACLHPSGPGDQAQMGTAAERTTLSDGAPGTANSGSPWSGSRSE